MASDMFEGDSGWKSSDDVFHVSQDVSLNLFLRQRFIGSASMFDNTHVITKGWSSRKGQGVSRLVSLVVKDGLHY